VHNEWYLLQRINLCYPFAQLKIDNKEIL